MRKAAVRHGDPTTTRGFVIAYSSTIHDDGKKVALSGDEATCENCKGTFKIFGTGKGMSEKGRDVVVEGDLVLCPCKKNRVIVGSDPVFFSPSLTVRRVRAALPPQHPHHRPQMRRSIPAGAWYWTVLLVSQCPIGILLPISEA
ncbi:PAAR domain-containing protein [Paraburkholderia sp. RL17-337-BIB-A]|uniref:PAAR domain-containing protein n=1 Tax=Paraburkholderia sp. RL17-337-BIB-A TaxID=3031636 RepID=UPI0038BE0B6E